MFPDFKYEKHYWKKGFQYIAGIDEVGRGALAGPLVAAAVIFQNTVPQLPVSEKSPDKNTLRTVLAEVKDSKLLRPKKRNRLSPLIKKHAHDYAFGFASVSEINHYGIFKATHMAMRRAITSLKRVDFVLVDAFYIPYLKGISKKNQLAIKHGDRFCFTIAAASIIAKVQRDKLMVELGNRYKQYLLHQHKGYGTLAHRNVILTYGAQHFHRKQFIHKLI